MWAALLLFFGTLLIIPTLIFFGIFAGSIRLAARKHILWVVPLGIALLAAPFIAWHKHRKTYQNQADAIVSRINAAPKLGQIKNPPSTILVRGHPFPEMDFGKPNCFPTLLLQHNDSTIREWNHPERLHPLPDRYLEFDVDEQRKSPFGDRLRTGHRGPYELWLIERNQRKLVNVFFIQGDGHMFIPPPILFVWAMMPTSLHNRELLPAWLNFIYRTTGQCKDQLE
jgi:hypothetical protein